MSPVAIEGPMEWGATLTASIALVAAGLYAAVARHVMQRHVGPGSVEANAGYAWGWGALAFMLLTDAGRLLAGALASPEVFLVLAQLKIIATACAVVGFGAYVLFLHTGRKGVSWGVPLGVATVYVYFFLALLHARLPLTLKAGRWATRMQLQPGSIFAGGTETGIVLFFLPLVLVTVLYLLLWRRLTTRSQHWRLLAVAVSLLVFLAASAVEASPRISPDAPTVPLASTAILATGIFSLWSFRPPAWLSRRLQARAA